MIIFIMVAGVRGSSGAHDPGVRGGAPGAGTPIAGLTANQLAFFSAGLTNFGVIDSVSGTISNTGIGLGPRFNAESCAQCHAQPASGGSSPSVNPQVAAATDQGATNHVPSFITANGPVREARFPYTLDLRHVDGGVHALFTITGRTDAPGCNIQQDDFRTAAREGDLIFRIPTPVFGGGLIEATSDAAILANMNANLNRNIIWKSAVCPIPAATMAPSLDSAGRRKTNRWRSFPARPTTWRSASLTGCSTASALTRPPSCQFNATPEDSMNFDLDGTALPSDITRFTMFMRFLDQPQPGQGSGSTQHGSQLFSQIGCALCHTASFTTGPSSVAALNNIPANLYSDILLHHMGPNLADNVVSQGAAAGDQFRTAPLWGLGQRIFFLHDGRTSDLVQAIEYHFSNGNRQYPSSEANGVVNNYNRLSPSDQQDLVNFLRSL